MRPACARRAPGLGDPTISDWDRPVPPPSAPPGARCAACGAAGDLYDGGNACFCRDRAGCVQREAADLSPWHDSSPDAAIAAAGGTLRLPAPHPPQAGPDPSPPGPDAAFAYEVWRAAQGRKR